jgi:uncharacterized membrane protein YqgA involved in biofilm formation
MSETDKAILRIAAGVVVGTLLGISVSLARIAAALERLAAR